MTGRLEIIATMFLQRYSDATSKVEKSNIVSAVIGTVRDACPGDQRGAFIKFREGRWWAVEESHVRERIGSILRDCVGVSKLHKSSSSSRPKAKNIISMRRSEPPPQNQNQNPLKTQGPIGAVAENSTSDTEEDDEESHNELLEWNQQLGVSYANLDEIGDDESSLSDVFD
jgi:hypothetical protein